jgi:hypothetical protein
MTDQGSTPIAGGNVTTPPTQVTNNAQNVTPPSGDWTTGLNEDFKGYVQNKGFKDPSSIIDSYRNLEKLLGAPKERLLRLPDKEDAPEWGDVFNRLGRPEKADQYDIKVPEGMGTDDFAQWARNNFHELGLSKKQGESLATKWNDYIQTAINQQNEQFKNTLVQEEQGLKKDWGMAFDQNINVAKQAAQAFGLDGPTIDKLEESMGFAGLMKFMHKIGSGMGEDNFVSGQNSSGFNGALSPQAAKQKIQDLRADNEFIKKYVGGDLSSRQEMERLHKFAYPEN